MNFDWILIEFPFSGAYRSSTSGHVQMQDVKAKLKERVSANDQWMEEAKSTLRTMEEEHAKLCVAEGELKSKSHLLFAWRRSKGRSLFFLRP